MTDLLVRAELIKVARALGAHENEVAFLAPLGHSRLRGLAQRISQALVDEHAGAFQRLGDASRLLPASLVAKMSELVFGPMLSARIAARMPPERAVEVARKLRARSLADICVELDPRSAVDLLAAVPTDLIVAVAQLLIQRSEHLTLGRFVDDLPDDAIRAVVDGVRDDEALLRIAFFVERRERLVELVETLPPARLRGMVNAAAEGPADLQAQGLAVISQLSARQQGRVGEAVVELGAPALIRFMESAGASGAGTVVEAVLQNVPAETRRRFVDLLADMEPPMLERWARAATDAGLWTAFLRELAETDAATQAKAAAALARLPARQMLAEAARGSGLADRLGFLRDVLR